MQPKSLETLVVKLNPDDPVPELIALAGDMLRAGELVAFPTETVYGLGANAMESRAVQQIFDAKQRPANDPVIVHLAQQDQLEQVAVDVPPLAYMLAERFWPGALTLVLRKHANVPSVVTAGQDTVAVRIPSHPLALRLIEEAGTPVAAPSANRFSRPSPTSAQHVLADLNGVVSLVIDGGAATIGVESTIINLMGDRPVVLRPGGVPLEALREIIPDLDFSPRYVDMDDVAPSPGTLIKHYSPEADVLVFQGETAAVYQAMHDTLMQYLQEGVRVGVLARDDEISLFSRPDVVLHELGHDEATVAANLFDGIRALDEARVSVILVRAPKRTGLGLAIWDRLVRAAEGQVIEVD